VSHIFPQVLSSAIALFAMMVAASWLLLHAASQWGRTRAEAKLLERIPHAAKHALGMQQAAGAGASGAAAASSKGGSAAAHADGIAAAGGGGGGAGVRGADDAAGAAARVDVPAKQQPAPRTGV
jgi:hypothetical protein